MQYDRKITISAAGSRKATSWPAQTIWLSEFYARLQTPTRSTETLANYMKLHKSQQDNLKDVGGFVGGALKGERRKAGNVISRDLLTLDIDNVQPGGTDDILRRVDSLGCGYCVYSTRKHSPAAPRLRVILPTDRAVTADEYEPVARMAAKLIDPEMTPFDPSTFEVSRLMYWPSCCSDSEYVYLCADKPLLSADGLLERYSDWRDMSSWPEVPGVQQSHRKLAARQGDPTQKPGVVGAFCRTYNIYSTLEKFLPGAYEPVDGMPDRYTYTGGSTAGGAVVYDNGAFLYSHHATDPASGRLCNAFDLVRLHLFSELDDEAKPETPVNKLPSYVAACKLAVSDPDVAALMDSERYRQAVEDFTGIAPDNTGEPANWMKQLAKSEINGKYEHTIKNVRIVLANDPLLKGRIKLNCFSDRIMGAAPLPWEPRRDQQEDFIWTDTDDSGLRDYIEQVLNIRGKDVIRDALIQGAAANRFDPVVDYLQSLKWDGVSRLDRLYIDYFGAEDCEYTRAVARKGFVGAVARALVPGVKFDTMTVVCGAQGIGKTTMYNRMGGEWFSNSLRSFEGKEAAELLQGIWIFEIGELEAFNKADIKLVKQFLSMCEDHYRAAYAYHTAVHPRRCVFFGTTNDHEYLKDPTGNRRFWPIDAGFQPHTKNVFEHLTPDEVGQLWAEAYVRYTLLAEPLILSPELEAEAEKRREGHMERDPLRGQIEEFLERPVPADWQRWDSFRRSLFLAGEIKGDQIELVPRDRVCALEIWRECLGERKPSIPRQEALRINRVLESLPGWERTNIIQFGCEYGKQRGFHRVKNDFCESQNNTDKQQPYLRQVATNSKQRQQSQK